MSLFLKLFNTTAEYNTYTADTANFILPNISVAKDAPTTVHYNPYVESSFFCKLTSTSGDAAKINGSGELTVDMVGNVFDETDEIETVVIGTLCTSIGEYAFYHCSNLTSCTIGSGVTSIGDNAFTSCYSLTSITVEAATPPTLGDSVFEDLVGTIYVPSASVDTYKAASGWSDYSSRIQAIP